jgi:hypothetical protein
MAKYRVDTDKGSYIVETEDPPVQQAPQSFSEQLWQEGVVNPARQVGAGILGASATANRMTANVADILNQASMKLGQITGLQPSGAFGELRDWARQQQHGQEQQAAELAGGRQDFPSQLYRGATQGVAELPTYAVAGTALGPVAGMAAVGAIRESDLGWKQALKAAAEGALLGKALHVMGPASRPIRLTGAAAMTYAQARLNGADNTTALAHATTMGGLVGHRGGGLGARDILNLNMPTRPLIPSRLNRVEAAAVADLKAEGVPLTGATQTGNRFLRAAEGVVEATPLGAVRAAEFRESTEQALYDLGGRLMEKAHKQPQSRESAGVAVRSGLQKPIEKLGQESDTEYAEAWVGRNDPQFTYEVPVRQEPILDDNGQPTGQMREVMKAVNMPVDIRDLKAQAEPLREEMEWALNRSDQSHNAAFNVLDKALRSDDFVPAWQAERGLSALKKMARVENKTGVRDVQQGTAASLISNLQEQIDAAVAHTGERAIQGLQEGRRLHKEMMDIVEIAEDLPAEPVQAFGRLVWPHDSGIDYARKVARETPDAMPKVGRAFVQDLFDRATREGGIARAKETLNRWRDLGPETKQLFFPDAELRSKIDSFFKGLSMVVERTNPSGTEITRQATSINPLRWLAGFAGGRVLFTPKGISLLTESLKVPPSSRHMALLQQQMAQERQKAVPGETALGRLGTVAGKATGEFWRSELGEEPVPEWLKKTGERLGGLPAEVGKMSPTEAEAAFQTEKSRTEPPLATPEAIQSRGLSGALDDAAEAALQRLRDRGTFSGTKLSAGIPVDDMGDMALWGAAKLARGTVDFAKWSKEILKEAGPAAAQIRPHLEDLYKRSQKNYDRFLSTVGGQLPDTRKVLEMHRKGIAGKDWYDATWKE